MMAFTMLRMVACALIGIGGGFGALVLLGFGDKGDALQTLIITAGIVWLLNPNSEDRADFAHFQKSRERFPS